MQLESKLDRASRQPAELEPLFQRAATEPLVARALSHPMRLATVLCLMRREGEAIDGPSWPSRLASPCPP